MQKQKQELLKSTIEYIYTRILDAFLVSSTIAIVSGAISLWMDMVHPGIPEVSSIVMGFATTTYVLCMIILVRQNNFYE